MDIKKKTAIFGVTALLVAGFSSCKNNNQEFPDYEGGITAYFANQYPVRVICLGEDPEQDNSLDNEHKFMIYATHGGSYESRNLKINVAVDPSLVNNLTFEDGTPVQAMPSNYYSLESTTLTKKKDFLFGTTVSLTDAFFADPAAIKNTYVVPLLMTDAVGADNILTGTPIIEGASPARCDADSWQVLPQDYTLYCVKFINSWHASWLRHGVDKVTENGATKDNVRWNKYVEKDEVVKLTTESLTKCLLPVSTTVENAGTINTLTCTLELTFNGNECTVSTSTPGMTASGNGKFVKDGEKKTYNNEDHDAIYLTYNVNFGPKQYATTDTLTFRSRDVAPEYFSPIYNK